MENRKNQLRNIFSILLVSIVGFSLLKFMNVYGGYSIPFDSEKNLKGFSIGVSINIGLTYMSKYYDKFVFMR